MSRRQELALDVLEQVAAAGGVSGGLDGERFVTAAVNLATEVINEEAPQVPRFTRDQRRDPDEVPRPTARVRYVPSAAEVMEQDG